MTAFTLEYDMDNYGMDAHVDLLAPAAIVEIDTDSPLHSISGLENFATVFAVFYSSGSPLGVRVLPINGDSCLVSDIDAAAAGFKNQKLRAELTKYAVPSTHEFDSSSLAQPIVNVIIPTCNRPDLLMRCLDGLRAQSYLPGRIIVVDNCPDRGDIKALLKLRYPDVSYLVCSAPGVSAARNTGAKIADSEYLAFLDDDVRPSPQWLENLIKSIHSDSRIAISTGLILPAEIKTESQAKMEALGGFNGGFRSRFVLPPHNSMSAEIDSLDFPKLGVGCNFLVRRASYKRVNGFDEEIGAGLGTDGEDVDFFSRVIQSGHIATYEPSAVVYHHHRQTEPALQDQLLRAARSTGYLWGRLSRTQPQLKASAKSLFWKYFRLQFSEALRASFRPGILSGKIRRNKLFLYCKGYLYGRFSRKGEGLSLWESTSEIKEDMAGRQPVAVRQLDLFRNLPRYLLFEGCAEAEIQVFCGDKYYTSLRIPITESVISIQQISAAIPDRIVEDIVNELRSSRSIVPPLESYQHAGLLMSGRIKLDRKLTYRPSVTVVIPTRDRPEDLNDCLWRISRQDYDGHFEVIVVDNNSHSGLSQPVVEKYPGFIYLSCDKPGAAATRNTGFRRAQGEIIVITDDDVLAPEGWVRRISEEFWRHDVWMVTGSVLPFELNSCAEISFEDGHGFLMGERVIEATGSVFRRSRHLPMAALGVSANMAFRRCILDNPEIGGMSETLGPGTAAGAGEDPEFIYRVLKEGHTVLFEPSIWIYHRHRRSMKEMYRQMYNYGKSATATYLHILIEYRDYRAVIALLFDIPRGLLAMVFKSDRTYWKLGVFEIMGYISGYAAFWKARIKDRRYNSKAIVVPPTVPANEHVN